jgi:hypothetical protein
MQVVFLIGCLVIALLSLSPTVSAQDTGQSAQNDEAAALLEEIRVVGDRSFFAIRFQIRDAEESLYAMFNELNSSDEFDIHCETIRITSTNIPRRICEPYFMVRARQANAIMSLAGIREALNFSDPENPAGAGIAASAWDGAHARRKNFCNDPQKHVFRKLQS